MSIVISPIGVFVSNNLTGIGSLDYFCHMTLLLSHLSATPIVCISSLILASVFWYPVVISAAWILWYLLRNLLVQCFWNHQIQNVVATSFLVSVSKTESNSHITYSTWYTRNHAPHGVICCCCFFCEYEKCVTMMNKHVHAWTRLLMHAQNVITSDPHTLVSEWYCRSWLTFMHTLPYITF